MTRECDHSLGFHSLASTRRGEHGRSGRGRRSIDADRPRMRIPDHESNFAPVPGSDGTCSREIITHRLLGQTPAGSRCSDLGGGTAQHFREISQAIGNTTLRLPEPGVPGPFGVASRRRFPATRRGHGRIANLETVSSGSSCCSRICAENLPFYEGSESNRPSQTRKLGTKTQGIHHTDHEPDSQTG